MGVNNSCLWCTQRDQYSENQFQNKKSGLSLCKPSAPEQKGPRDSKQLAERPTLSKRYDEDNQIFIGNSVWIGYQSGDLKEYDKISGALVKDYGRVFPGPITQMSLNSDKKYLFTSDAVGNVKGWDVEKHSYFANFGAVVENDQPVVLTDLTVRNGDNHDTYQKYEDGFLQQKAIRFMGKPDPSNANTVRKRFVLEIDD